MKRIFTALIALAAVCSCGVTSHSERTETGSTRVNSVLETSKNDHMDSYRSIYEYILANTSGVEVKGQEGEKYFLIRGMKGPNMEDVPALVLLNGNICKDLDGVMPKDVETVEVIKDATAFMTYGAIAQGGVITITTKQYGNEVEE